MQAYLWKHRAKLKDLIVYADEPFVPWELVHLKPPEGPRPEKAHFLAQNGLVRWHLNSFPPREIRVRKGHAKSLCPEYRDPQFALVRTRLRAAVPRGAVRGQAGHRHPDRRAHAAALRRVRPAALLRPRRRQTPARSSTRSCCCRGASAAARWSRSTSAPPRSARTPRPAGESGIGPVVVLNACQVGQAGELLTTVGGFAKAFLDAGASAFVSCLWSVHQEPSRIFVEKLYEELLDGTPMATASARAREAARKAGDATWLAFVVYSRPDAVLVRS